MSNPDFDKVASAPQSFLFLHIPKTAGSSMNVLIESRVLAETFCQATIWETLQAIPQANLSTYSVFCGHFAGDFFGYIGRELLQLTMLRRPLPRAISHYWYMHRSPHHRLHHRVRELNSLSAALRDPVVSVAFQNFQARYLAYDGPPWPGVTPLLWTEPEDRLLQHAKERLDRMLFVGTTERFQESLQLMAHLLDWARPAEIRTNENPNKDGEDSLTPADRDLLISMNQVDLAVYAYAEQLLDAKLQEMEGPGIIALDRGPRWT